MELHNQATAHDKIVAAIVRSVLSDEDVREAIGRWRQAELRAGLVEGILHDLNALRSNL